MRKHASLLLTWLLTVERMQETRSLCCELKNSGESHSDDCHDQTAPPLAPPGGPVCWRGCGLRVRCCLAAAAVGGQPRSSQPGGRSPVGRGQRHQPHPVVVGVIRGGGSGEDAQETQEDAQLDPETVVSITRGAVSRTFWDAV